MKLLVVASSLDLRAPLGVTPSLWQLLKALAELGIELVVAPYQGPAIESPWWTAADNPCQREGQAVGFFKRWLPARQVPTAAAETESIGQRLMRTAADRVTKPRWRKHLVEIIESQRDFDAVLFLFIPPNHFGGIASLINRRFGLPSYYFDGDVPASLPSFAGFQSGFRIYQGADLSEYAGVFTNSKGGIPDLLRLGARSVKTSYYAADPSLFAPQALPKDVDVFFYGLGREYREEWLSSMLETPSHSMPAVCFAVRGKRLGSLPHVRRLPYASFSRLKTYCNQSRINLLITRRTHANVYASSTARPFELAALGCAIVSNPYLGIEEWFQPGEEVLTVRSSQEAIDTYDDLLRDASARQELGRRARARLLAEHTYAHRAAELRAVVSGACD